MTEKAPELPPIGSQIMMPIVAAQTRTTIFAEAAIVASPGPDAVELVFLRNEVFVPVQTGTVVAHDGLRADVSVTASPASLQLTDIGHVRMPQSAMLTLVISAAQQLVNHHGVKLEEITSGLTKALDVTKSAQ